MFQSSGFFKNANCPFYKHDLCHRPYCHFKHVKSRKEKEKAKDDVIENNNAESADTHVEIKLANTEKKKHKSRQRTPSPIDPVNDDVLKIVKNISPSKLIEYAKRKQEVQELQQTLEQVDKETKEIIESVPTFSTENIPSVHTENNVSTVRSEEEIKRGLIDSFYSKAKVDVNITSGDIVDKPKETITSLNDVTQEKGSKKEKIICNCDDPDCSGFREAIEGNHFTHTTVDLDQIEDEYMRRKMQRRLDRKKKTLTQSETFSFGIPVTNENILDTNISESDFVIPAMQSSKTSEPEPENGVDEDLSNYIDKCKEEYAKSRREKLSVEKKKVLSDDVEKNKSNAEKRSSDVEEEGESSVEKNMLTREDKNKKSSGEKEKNLSSGDKQKSAVEKKKSLSDINFFSTNVAESNTGFTEMEPEMDGNEAFIANEELSQKKLSKKRESLSDNTKDADIESNPARKKKRVNSLSVEDKPSEEDGCGEYIQVKKKKTIRMPLEETESPRNTTSIIKTGETKDITKKKVSFPDKISDKPKILDKSDKPDNDKLEKVNSDKAIKTNNCSKHDKNKLEKGNSNKKVKMNNSSKHDNDKLEKANSDKKVKMNHSSKHDNDKLEKGNSDKKVKMNNSSKHDNDKLAKGNSEKKIKTNHSTKHDTSNINDLKYNNKDSGKILEGNAEKKLKKKTRTDSESSNSSRNAFDIIAISSSEDDASHEKDSNHNSDEENISAYDPISSPDYEYVLKNRDRRTSSSDKEDVAVNSRVSGEAKKRVALTNEEIHRKPVQPHKSKSMSMSYVSPGLKSTGKDDKVVNKPTPIPKPTITASAPINENPSSTGKKRVSHVKPSPINEKVDERPKLQMDIGGKIPHILRQKYFDKVIDELIPKMASKKEAFEKGIAEEADAYKRSSRKPIYMNICANIIKRIRSMPDYIAPKEQSVPNADPMRTGQPTTKSVKSDSLQTNTSKVDTVKSVSRLKSSTIAGYRKIAAKETIPKNCIKPASSTIVNATVEKTPGGKRERSNSLSLEQKELTEDNFYDHMQQYLLTKEQLWDNRYPRRDPDNRELTQVKDYVPSSNALKRLCCRCGSGR